MAITEAPSLHSRSHAVSGPWPRLGLALALCAGVPAALPAPAGASPGESAPDTARIYDSANYARPYARGEVILAFRPGYTGISVAAASAAKGLRLVRELAAARAPGARTQAAASRRVFLYRAAGADPLPSVIAALRKDPNVAYAEPNYIRRLQAVPDDSLFASQWGMRNIGRNPGWVSADIHAPEAWDWHTGNKSLVLGVIDDGIDYRHPDLAANIWTNAAEANGRPGVDDDGNGYVDDIHGYDFVNHDPDPMPDGTSHGTHVAGTIAAAGNNRIGVAGVAWNANLAALKIFDSTGATTDAAIIEAIHYANAMGMRITNNSWGGGGYSQSLHDAIAEGGQQGNLFIAAAGNDSSDCGSRPCYPAGFDLPNIVSVAATNDTDGLAAFSNYGSASVDLGAPGQAILSTAAGGGYVYMSGTSMAAPHVAGAAYLIWSFRNSLTAAQVKDILLRSVDPIPSLQGVTVTGGRLNLAKAATAAAPPVLALAPGRFIVRVDPGGSADRDFDLSNAGSSNLRYLLGAAPGADWLSAAPAAASGGASSAGLPFSDGFENGRSDNWIPMAGAYTRSVTNATAASGTYSFTQAGGFGSEYDGVYAGFPAGTRPVRVSFSVRSANAASDAGYFAMGDLSGLSIVCNLGRDGRVRVNGNGSRPYQANRWYGVRFQIDWGAGVFDYYLNDTLVAQGLPFGQPSSELRGVYLYNSTPGSQAWYDDFRFDNAGFPPVSGVLAPASAAKIRLAFNAAGLSPGAYSAGLSLAHNAPNANNPVAVPCSLIVGFDRPPTIAAGPDRAVNEGQPLAFAVSASDPDADSVALSLLDPPAGASFSGGAFAWTPGFDQAGRYDLIFRAQSGSPALADTDTVRVTVNEVDRPPRLDPVPAQAIDENQRLAFPVSASDPDGDPVSIVLLNPPPGSAFAANRFAWVPAYTQSGTYRLRFVALSRALADTLAVDVTVRDAGSGLGTLRLVGAQPGTRFYLMPAGDWAGSLLGSDSVDVVSPPGWYWVQAARQGCRPLRFAAAIRMDTVRTRRAALRPAVPMLFAPPETLLVDGRPYFPSDSAAPLLADLDLDGKEDLVVAAPGGLEFFAGLDADSAGGRRFQASRAIGFAPEVRAGLVAAAFADWDDDGFYDLIGSDSAGRVFLSRSSDTLFTGKSVLLARPGERCHPFVLDYDGDGRKDLGIWSEGKGLFFYRNEGTAAAPVLSAAPWPLTDAAGRGLPELEGPPAWLGLSGGTIREFLAAEGGRLRRFETPSTGEGRLALGKREDVNLSGAAFACPACRYAGALGERDRPRLIRFVPGKPAMAYTGHLAGDFDRDGKVDLRDYSRLLDAWERTEADADWNPMLNLRLDPGPQRIDVEDLGWFGDLWELEE